MGWTNRIKLNCFLTGIPAVIVSLVLVIDKDAYGSLADEEIEMVLDSTEAL